MTNQVILYDRMANDVKLIDGIKTISLKKAQKMGFTPRYLMQVAITLLSLNHDQASQNALKMVQKAIKECSTSQWDQTQYIISYDRMSDKVKIFGGAITIPFKIALHKGVTPAHMVQMAVQLLSVRHETNAIPSAKKALEACKLAQVGEDKYKNKRYK